MPGTVNGRLTLTLLAFVSMQGCSGDALSPPLEGPLEPQYATTAGTACTLGNVETVFQAPFVVFGFYGSSHPLADLVESCQYRLFLPTYPDGSPITFDEGEPFLGGIVFTEPFDSDQPNASVQELEKIEVQNWLTEVTEAGFGDPIEQTVRKSAVKQAVRNGELVTAQQWGVITALPAGEYVSTTVANYAGELFDSWTVNIFIY